MMIKIKAMMMKIKVMMRKIKAMMRMMLVKMRMRTCNIKHLYNRPSLRLLLSFQAFGAFENLWTRRSCPRDIQRRDR